MMWFVIFLALVTGQRVDDLGQTSFTAFEITEVFGWPGNPLCFQNDDFYSFERCCDQRLTPHDYHHFCFYDPLPHASWYTYERCCFRPVRPDDTLAPPPDVDNVCWMPGEMRSWQTCCDPVVFDPLVGNASCWEGNGFTFSRCCHRKLPDKYHGRAFMTSTSMVSGSSQGVSDFFHGSVKPHSGGSQAKDTEGKRLVSDKVLGALNKVLGHSYHRMYGMFLSPLRNLPIKMMEVGLGCYLHDNTPGLSLGLWNNWFRHEDYELWVADYDFKCYEQLAKPVMDSMPRVNFLYGNQYNPASIASWVMESGGGFDVVVDDGAHSNEAIRTTFHGLWPYVKPGGLYFIEDLSFGRTITGQAAATPLDQGHLNASASKPFIDSIKEWIDALVIQKVLTGHDDDHGGYWDSAADILHHGLTEDIIMTNPLVEHDPLPVGVDFITCFNEACVIAKEVPSTMHVAHSDDDQFDVDSISLNAGRFE